MRTLFLSLGLVLLAMVFAGSDRASAGSFESATVSQTAVSEITVASVQAEPAEHCAHIPCTNAAHSHTSGACAAHSFVAIGEGFLGPDYVAADVIGLKHERHAGLTLLPPVPPPLA